MISRTEVAPEIIQVVLHLKDEAMCAVSIAKKVGLTEDTVREILARREPATRERAAVYSTGRSYKRHTNQTAASLSDARKAI